MIIRKKTLQVARLCCYRRRYSSTVSQANNYCMQLVKKHDYDHYLTTLLLPRLARKAVFALRAFNVEVALIGDVASNQNIALMRMQFWKDTLNLVFEGNPPKQPVALALSQAFSTHRLTKNWLTRLLKAREKALSDPTYLTSTEMETYAENTFSSLLYLSLEAAEVRNLYSDHAASHLGKAEGIITFLRSVPYYASKRQVLLPVDVLLRHGASQEDVLRKNMEQPLKDAIFDLSSLAHVHLKRARSQAPHLLSSTRKVLLPCVTCDKFLKQIQQADFNPFCPSLTQRDSMVPFHLMLKKFLRTY